MALSNKIALVTGASRGVGKGIALQLAEAGATVYITGRTYEKNDQVAVPGSLQETAEQMEKRGGRAIPVKCDHTKDEDVNSLFERIEKEQGRLDILVNNAYAVEPIMKYFGQPFWEVPYTIWDDINSAGLRNHYICSVKAAKLMVKQNSGLIIVITSIGADYYDCCPVYGIGKKACERMAADCALELASHNVAYIAVRPGPVSTERMTAESKPGVPNIFELPPGETSQIGLNKFLHENVWNDIIETPEFSGKCIVALAADPDLMKKTGKPISTSALGKEYNLVDINGKTIEEWTWVPEK